MLSGAPTDGLSTVVNVSVKTCPTSDGREVRSVMTDEDLLYFGV